MKRFLSAPLFWIMVGLGLFYGIAVFGGDYLYADDYYIRHLIVLGKLTWWDNLFTQMGRPIFGLFNNVIFRVGEVLTAYAGVRAFGLLGTMLCAGRFYWIGRQMGWNGWVLTGLALLVFCNPGWAVFVGWTMCAAFPWAGWLALEAGWLALRACDGGEIAPKDRILLSLGGLLLALLSMGIYQVTISFALLPLLLSLAASSPRPRIRLLATRSVGVWSLIAMAYLGSFAFLKWVKVAVFAGENEYLNRDGFVTDPWVRLNELRELVAPRLLTQWADFLASWVSVALGALLLLGLGLAIVPGLFSRRAWKESGLRFLVFLPSLLLAAAPILLLAENNFSWRILTGVIAVLVVGVASLLPWNRLAGGSDSRCSGFWRFAWFLGLGGWAAAQWALGAYVFAEGLVLPNVRETARWKEVLDSKFTDRPVRLIYFSPPWDADRLSRITQNREYGHGTASYVWFTPHAVAIYLGEIYADARSGTTYLTTIPEEYRSEEEDCFAFLSGREIVGPGTAAKHAEAQESKPNAFFGDIELYGDGWGRAWIGTFNWSKWPWLQHASLGWLRFHEAKSSAKVLYVVDQASQKEYLFRPERPGEIYSTEDLRWMDYCEFQNEETRF
jgi:hypothetical protein